jgi:hypothetical protein
LVDNYIDWFTNIGYGISGVEKTLTYLRQKNVLQALTMNASAATVFPAQLVYADAFRDDTEVNFSPGALMNVSHTPLGLDVIKPVPAPATGLQLGLQDLRFWGDEIRAKMGVDGLAAGNAARSITKGKTATEVNSDESSGSTFIDDHVENSSYMLTEYCQGAFEESRKNLKPDAEGNLAFERALADRVTRVTMPFKQFDVERTIQVQGYLGSLNKAQEMQNIQMALQMTKELSQALPNGAMVLQKLWARAMERLNMPLSPQELMSPQQIAAADPKVQLQAVQAGMQDPEVIQAALDEQHKARQLAFDQQQEQQPNVQNGQAQGSPGAETIPSQGF